MSETLSREAWLRMEIALDREYAARYRSSDDPVERAQSARRQREADVKLTELEGIRSRARFVVSLAGREIEGHNAPLDVVKRIVSRFGVLADEYHANVLVAPSSSGSHVIEFTGPQERTLFDDGSEFDEDTAFVAAARVLIDLSPVTVRFGERWDDVLEQRAAELSGPALSAARGFVDVLADHGLGVKLDLATRHGGAHVSIRREDAAYAGTVLAGVDRTEQRLQLTGILSGFTKGSGRFELDAADGPIVGRVPMSLRDAADGIEIGHQVAVEVEQITTQLKSGDVRIRYKLVSISSTT